jgi:hypothetical protein
MPAALHKTHNRHKVSVAARARSLLGLRRIGEEGFVGFHDLALPAQLPNVAARSHCRANTMGQVPRGFHAATEQPLDLTGADALLAGAHEVNDLKPQVQRKVRRLENGPHPHGKGLLAGVALAKAGAGSFALKLAYALPLAAKRANRTIRPQVRLHEIKGRVLVLILGLGEDVLGHWRHSRFRQEYRDWGLVCQV